jgi:hypothetical protein
MYTSLLSLLEFSGHPLHLNPVAARPQHIHRTIILPKLLPFQSLAHSISSANLPGESGGKFEVQRCSESSADLDHNEKLRYPIPVKFVNQGTTSCMNVSQPKMETLFRNSGPWKESQ